MTRVLFATVALVTAALATPTIGHAAPPPDPRVRYDGHQVVRVWPADVEQLQDALGIVDDVWTERIGLGPIDARVSPGARAALDASGIQYEVRIADVQLAVDDEYARLHAAAAPSQAPGAWFSDFKTVDAIDGYLDTLADEFGDLVSVEPVGTSLDGRPIRALRITAGSSEGKAALILTGTQHAREWLSPMTVTCIADTLARDYGSDPVVTDALDTLEFFVVPVVNPDGYARSWSGDRYWRKNTRGGYGVDLNRNWGFQWGGDGSSGNPGDETFRGDAAFSEPESQALAAYMGAQSHAVGFIDFHSFAELILYPWGYQYGDAPEAAELSQLAGQMASAIQSTHGYAFDAIQGSDLYPAAGVIDDWAYGEHGMMAFTVELRGSDFVIGPQHIIASCEENLQAVLTLAQWAKEFSDPVGGDSGGTAGDGDSPSAGDDDDAADNADADADPTRASADDEMGEDPDDGNDATAVDDGDDTGSGDGALDDDGLPGALPAAYGLGVDATGCVCQSSGSRGRTAPAWLWLAMGLGVVRPRRSTARSTRSSAREKTAAASAAARRAPPSRPR